MEDGVEGWIDSGIKYTWANGFNNKIKQLTASGNILHDYKIEEREGTNDNDDRYRVGLAVGEVLILQRLVENSVFSQMSS